jgi:hypothetical protein
MMERPDRSDVNRASGQSDGTDRATAYPDDGSGFQPSIRTGTYDVRCRIIEYVAPYTKGQIRVTTLLTSGIHAAPWVVICAAK